MSNPRLCIIEYVPTYLPKMLEMFKKKVKKKAPSEDRAFLI